MSIFPDPLPNEWVLGKSKCVPDQINYAPVVESFEDVARLQKLKVAQQVYYASFAKDTFFLNFQVVCLNTFGEPSWRPMGLTFPCKNYDEAAQILKAHNIYEHRNTEFDEESYLAN